MGFQHKAGVPAIFTNYRLKDYTMTKRKDNEPDNKAAERLREFNRQRQPVSGENRDDQSAPEDREQNTGDNDKKKKEPEKKEPKKSIKKSPKNDKI